MTIFLNRYKNYIGYLRIRPYDTSTESGRAQERQRRIVLTILANFAAKGITLLTSVISIRLTVNYLGAERFGMWALISSFTAMMAFADLGIGNGLLNSISDANGKNDRAGAHQYVTSAFGMLLLIVVILGAVFTFLYTRIPWELILNVTSQEAINEAGPAMAIFVVCTLINIPLGVVQRIHIGYQEGYFNSLWLVAGNILALIIILFFIHLEVGLPYLVLALVGSPVLAQLLNGFFLFVHQRPWLVPQKKLFSIEAAKHIMRLGFLFFVLQLAIAIGYESDSFIITQHLGAEAVTQYAIPKRLFSIVISMLGVVLSPLWPAYGEAIARKDGRWINSVFKNSLLFSSVMGISSAFILLVFSKSILQLWVGSTVLPTTNMIIGLASWLILYSILNPCAMFMNGANIIGFQVVTASLMTISNVLISIFLVQKIGVAGPIWGTVLSLALFILVPTILYIKAYLRKMQYAP